MNSNGLKDVMNNNEYEMAWPKQGIKPHKKWKWNFFGWIFLMTRSTDAPPNSLINSTELQMWKQRKDEEFGYVPWLATL
jgi:hypothetical protein